MSEIKIPIKNNEFSESKISTPQVESVHIITGTINSDLIHRINLNILKRNNDQRSSESSKYDLFPHITIGRIIFKKNKSGEYDIKVESKFII